MLFLFTMIYSLHAKQKLVQTFLIFATVLELRAISPSNYTLFHLSHDFKSDMKMLIRMIENRARSYHSCPKFNLPQFFYETFAKADERRKNEHRVTMNKCLGIFVNALICQWPETNVCDLVDSDFNIYIFVNEATKNAQI